MSKPETDPDDEQERINQLEAVVREQQRELEALAETLGIENPREEAKKFSRRAALGLGAAGVAGAAGYATGSARAQSQPAGTIGDGDEAVDVQSVNTGELNNAVAVSVDKFGGADIGEAWNNARAAHPDAEAFSIVPGTYDVATTFNWTDMDHVDVDLSGVVLQGTTSLTNGIVIDATNTRFPTVYGGIVSSKNDGDADIGVLRARNNDASNNSDHLTWVGGYILGGFNTCGVYNFGSEEDRFIGTTVGTNGTAAHGYIATSENSAGVSSVYETIEPGTNISTNGHYFDSGSRLFCAANDSTHAGFYGEGAVASVETPGIILCDAFAHVLYDVGPAPNTLIHDNTRFHPAAGGIADHCIKFQSDGGTIVQGVSVRNSFLNAASDVVEADLDGITIIGLDYNPGFAKGGDAASFRTVQSATVQQPNINNYTNTTLDISNLEDSSWAMGQDISLIGPPEDSSWYITGTEGSGLIISTPDNSAAYRIHLDNAGNVTTTVV